VHAIRRTHALEPKKDGEIEVLNFHSIHDDGLVKLYLVSRGREAELEAVLVGVGQCEALRTVPSCSFAPLLPDLRELKV
jgi:hypothetical protein